MPKYDIFFNNICSRPLSPVSTPLYILPILMSLTSVQGRKSVLPLSFGFHIKGYVFVQIVWIFLIFTFPVLYHHHFRLTNDTLCHKRGWYHLMKTDRRNTFDIVINEHSRTFCRDTFSKGSIFIWTDIIFHICKVII